MFSFSLLGNQTSILKKEGIHMLDNKAWEQNSTN